MTTTTKPDLIDAYQECLKEGTEKFGKWAREAATMRGGLEIAAADAEATGNHEFAEILRAVARQFIIGRNGKKSPGSSPSRRRSRSAKPGTDQTASA